MSIVLRQLSQHPDHRVGVAYIKPEHILGYRYATDKTETGVVLLEVFLSSGFNLGVADTEENAAVLREVMGPSKYDGAGRPKSAARLAVEKMADRTKRNARKGKR